MARRSARTGSADKDVTGKDTTPISLALQGGGAHGAFTWGVLDRLLEAQESGLLAIAALSGTSAGAMNATVCGYGLKDGPAAARALLEEFWRGVNRRALALGNPYMFLPWNAGGKGWNFDDLPVAMAAGIGAQVWSPYMNPFHQNPLEAVIDRVVADFGILHAPGNGVPAVYIAATDVGTGSRAVFRPEELSTDVLLASACLPNLEPAVRIGDAWYWDGGFTANPALDPLIPHADDMVVVQLNPCKVTGGPPRTAAGIADRVNEISFNISLVQEVAAIETVNRLLDFIPEAERPKTGKKPVRFHMVTDESFLAGLGLVSKYNLNWNFLQELREQGRAAADTFLAAGAGDLGERSSVDVKRDLVEPNLRGR